MGFFRSPRWESVTYWALDLEMGGLDPRTDPILAVGMVPIREGTIRLGEAYRTLVRPVDGGSIEPGSVRAHQILWGDVKEAPLVAEVVPEIARRLHGAVLVVHHRGVDLPFLRRDFKAAGVRWPAPPVVDTAKLIVRMGRMAQPDLPHDMHPLHLADARRSYGLPEYQAHDALTDAVATAELLLVLRRVLGARSLRDLL
ncbi:MAG TPA: 3'-5' exonuclease [Anaeromyxobacter sp.]